MTLPRCNNCGDILFLPNLDGTKGCPNGCVDDIYLQKCHACGELLGLPEVNGIKPCVNGCSPKIRKALTLGDLNKPNGTAIDGPQLPVKILIDDIEQVVIEAEVQGADVPTYFTYKLTPFPPSHHVE